MSNSPNNFPENFLRGVVVVKHIIPETGGVTFDLFMPDTRTATQRDDGGEEVSINWEDNENVIEFTLNCRNDNGNFLFPNGVVQLKREEIHRINKSPTLNHPLSYERRELDNNPYHGNIIFRQGLSERVKKMIATALAVSASTVFTKTK